MNDNLIITVTSNAEGLAKFAGRRELPPNIDFDGDKSIDDLAEDFSRGVLKDIMDRVKSGELDNSTPISLPQAMRDRLIASFERTAKQFCPIFSYSVDSDGQIWLDWPRCNGDEHAMRSLMEDVAVNKALHRLATRSNIRAIHVTKPFTDIFE